MWYASFANVIKQHRLWYRINLILLSVRFFLIQERLLKDFKWPFEKQAEMFLKLMFFENELVRWLVSAIFLNRHKLYILSLLCRYRTTYLRPFVIISFQKIKAIFGLIILIIHWNLTVNIIWTNSTPKYGFRKIREFYSNRNTGCFSF